MKPFNLGVSLSVLFVLIFVCPVYSSNGQMEGSIEVPIFFGSSTDKKLDYQLQEKCGKKCEKFFNKKYNLELLNDQRNTTYQNHYNNKLNKCFMVVKEHFIDRDLDNKPERTIVEDLYDVNENKLIGSFTMKWSNLTKSNGILCKFLNKECKSQEEWDILVKPYMEE